MSYSHRRHLSWAIRDMQEGQRALQSGDVTLEPVKRLEEVPGVLVHFGYLTGGAGKREFTGCRKKSAGRTVIDDWSHVSCRDCLAAHARELAFIANKRG